MDCLVASLMFEGAFPKGEVLRQRRRRESAVELDAALRAHLPVLLEDLGSRVRLLPSQVGERPGNWLWWLHARLGAEAQDVRARLVEGRLIQRLVRGDDLDAVRRELDDEEHDLSDEQRTRLMRLVPDFEAWHAAARSELQLHRAIGKRPGRKRIEAARREAGIKPAQLKRVEQALANAPSTG
jgi:hypothetical protein